MTGHRNHRYDRITMLLSAVVSFAVFGTAPAHAAAAASAVCTTTFTATIAPGFTMKPSAGKLTSRGLTGSLECFGELGGQRIAGGSGSMGFVERHTQGTCRGHVGTGRVHLIIPTTAGSKDIVGTLAVRRTGLTVRVEVRFPGLRFRGNGVIFPRLGDCATTPLEQIKVTITGSFTETPKLRSNPRR